MTLRCTRLCQHYKLWLCGVLITAKHRHVYHQTAHKQSLLLLSHPRRAICFSSHSSLHLAASALVSSHSDRTHGNIVIGVTARTCSISNTRWTRWLICGERNPFSLFGLNTSQHCPALLVSTANIYVSTRSGSLESSSGCAGECLHKHIF